MNESMMIKNATQRIRVIGVAALLALSATLATAQSVPQIELPKIEEPRIIGIAFNRQGQGRITAANREGKVHQWMEVWENKAKIPNVVTYLLVGKEGKTYFSATWGKGPVNTDAFGCSATEIPDFGEKTFWVVTVTDGVLTFQEINDEDIKGLFGNLTKARRDWDIEVDSSNPKRFANTTQNNLLGFLKKKNREKWLQLGWLKPATSCVRHF